jgi:L-asparaginase II
VSSEPLVLVQRGGITESIHRGHVAVVDSSGKIVAAYGNPHFHTYTRSALKPLQAISVLESGAAERFNLSDKEIVAISSSHSGEVFHIGVVESILHKIGCAAGVLQCGAHPPLHKVSAQQLADSSIKPTAVHNNCSGKHSGMVATALALGAHLETYRETEHPVQQLILSIVAEICGIPMNEIDIGIDGCGVPVFGMPISNLAQGFARFGDQESWMSPRKEYCRRIGKAIVEHPFVLAGSDRFDSLLIEATKGRLLVKSGAEGIAAISDTANGLGIVVRVEDGAERAVYPAVMETLEQLGLIDSEERKKLDSFHHPVMLNWAGTQVGSLNPVLRLRDHVSINRK